MDNWNPNAAITIEEKIIARMRNEDVSFHQAVHYLSSRKRADKKGLQKYDYTQEMVRRNHIKRGVAFAADYSLNPTAFERRVTKWCDLKPEKPLLDQLDQFYFVGPLMYVVGSLGAFLLSHKWYQWNGLVRGEAYQRMFDFLES